MRTANFRLTNFLLILLLGIALFGCRKGEQAPAPETGEKGAAAYAALLPQEAVPSGWQQSDPVRVFRGKKLYDSIDGAADRFFQYAFREQYVVMYSSNPQGRRIHVEVYDMGTPDDAFGIFSCHDSVMAERANVGLAATISEVSLDFCKGKYFVRLLGMGFDKGEARKPLSAFAETITGNIEAGAGFPPLLGRLPRGYVPGSVLFFHTWPTLNERRYIADEDVFKLGEKTNGVLAAYTPEEKKSDDQTFKLEKDVVYLIQYPDESTVRSAVMDYINSLDKRVKDSRAPGQPEEEQLQLIGLREPTEIYQLYKGAGTQKHLTTVARVFRNYVYGVWDVTDAEKAKTLTRDLEGNLRR